MFEHYLYEIVALIIISLSIIIYVRIRKAQKDENYFEVKKTTTQHYPSSAKAKKEDITETVQTEKKFSKTPVPEHGKITKKHFQEFKGMKLLVVEDNHINQKVIHGLLEGSGIFITMADDGEDALNILKDDSNFDLVLMDAHMPKINGFTATKIIRENPNYSHLPVIALSGDTSSDDIKKMLDAGMEEHLEKPLKIDALYDIFYAYSNSRVIEKNLDTAQGLAICGADRNFYQELLQDFLKNYSNTSKDLTSLLEKNNLEKADALLLDFIGVSANLGAFKVKKTALALKEAINDVNEKNYKTLLDELTLQLKALVGEIEDYLT